MSIKLMRAIYLIFGLIEALLLIRFVLKALGATAEAGFAQFIYGITGPLVVPWCCLLLVIHFSLGDAVAGFSAMCEAISRQPLRPIPPGDRGVRTGEQQPPRSKTAALAVVLLVQSAAGFAQRG
jgi:hypothetical protein